MKARILRGSDIRMRNERLVLYTIFSSDGISQSEVVQLTGLKPPTVLRLFSSLVQQGFIEPFEKVSVVEERRGRRPVYYRTKPDALYSAGMELWSNSIAVSLMDFSGKPVVSFSSNTKNPYTPDTVIQALSSAFRTALAKIDLDPSCIHGLGVACSGWLDEENGVIRNWSEGEALTGFGLKDALEAELGLGVRLLSAAPTAALGVMSDFGLVKESIVMVILREGVDGAFIIRSSESGTSIAVRLAPGDLPADGSARSDAQPVWQHLNEKRLLEKLSQNKLSQNVDDISVDNINEYLEGNRKAVHAALSEETSIFSRMILTVVQMLNPERIIVSMRSRTLSELFARAGNAMIESWSHATGRQGTTVLPTVYRDGTVARAAAQIIMENFFCS